MHAQEIYVIFIFVPVIPGPVVTSSATDSEKNVSIFWRDAAGLRNVSGYRLSVERVGFTEAARNFTTTSMNITVADLIPGALYAVRIVALRESSQFGKTSEETLYFVRTRKCKLASRDLFVFV